MIKKLKLSQWHDGSAKPVHVGVYEVEWNCDHPGYAEGKWFNFWDGKRFHVGDEHANGAVNITMILPKKMNPIRWRGVLK